jgi:hypothetical protein
MVRAPGLHVLAAWLSDLRAVFSTNFRSADDRLYSLFHDSTSIRVPLTFPFAVADPLEASAVPSGGDNSFTHCVEDDLSGIVEPQLLHQIGTMCFNRIGAQVENRSRLLVRFSFRQELKGLALTFRQ